LVIKWTSVIIKTTSGIIKQSPGTIKWKKHIIQQGTKGFCTIIGWSIKHPVSLKTTFIDFWQTGA
jgi:hypothetical protein